jgi:hypothetical protein
MQIHPLTISFLQRLSGCCLGPCGAKMQLQAGTRDHVSFPLHHSPCKITPSHSRAPGALQQYCLGPCGAKMQPQDGAKDHVRLLQSASLLQVHLLTFIVKDARSGGAAWAHAAPRHSCRLAARTMRVGTIAPPVRPQPDYHSTIVEPLCLAE